MILYYLTGKYWVPGALVWEKGFEAYYNILKHAWLLPLMTNSVHLSTLVCLKPPNREYSPPPAAPWKPWKNSLSLWEKLDRSQFLFYFYPRKRILTPSIRLGYEDEDFPDPLCGSFCSDGDIQPLCQRFVKLFFPKFTEVSGQSSWSCPGSCAALYENGRSLCDCGYGGEKTCEPKFTK